MHYPTYTSEVVHTSAGNHQWNTVASTVTTPRQFVYNGEKTLTESTATIVLNITLGTGKYLGGVLTATTHANDATDYQACTDSFAFAAVNKAGTVTAVVQASPITSLAAASAGTLSEAWTIVVNGASVDLKCNAVSSLTQTVLKCSYQLVLNSDGPCVVT